MDKRMPKRRVFGVVFPPSRRRQWLRIGCLAVIAALIVPSLKAGPNGEHFDIGIAPALAQSQTDRSAVVHMIERRCVVCHGCYDAPCQFLMTSDDGIARGASKQPVYHADRLEDAPMTRLGIDATTVAQWRALGFFDVGSDPGGDAAGSLLQQMLTLGRSNPVPSNAPLPPAVDLDITRSMACPAPADMAGYARANPYGGMPYGMAALEEAEWDALSAWAGDGAPPLRRSTPMNDATDAQIATWEGFLNGETLKERLVARYLYEHLFLAHLYFPETPEAGYFKLLRSKTPPGTPIDPIATRRPYDDPGTDTFYYRLQPINGTILHKTHIVYEIGPEKLARYRQLFMGDDWQATALPSYEPAVAANPFASFAAIPARARYTFLLDDVEYFIRTFIRGPVCRGQVAVDVIEDRFWVMFLEPDADLSVTDPSYLAEVTPYLGLPAAKAEGSLRERLFPGFLAQHRQYTALRAQRYDEADPQKKGPALDDIWAGWPEAGAALLTIFRHFDNATVVGGFVGDTPKTAWVIDFPILERIYYNLVAGFDIFGSVESQLATRIYMDLLRLEGEDVFLSFLPADVRRPLHDYWYRGGAIEVRLLYERPPADISRGTQIAYSGDDPKAELLEMALARDESGVSKTDPVNRPEDDRSTLAPYLTALTPLASTTGRWVRYLPNVALLRIEGTAQGDRVVALVHNKAHSNVAYLFAESLRREPQDDTVTLIDGPLGSYPNFFLTVDAAGLPDFVAALKAMRNERDWRALVEAYGVRRSSPDFWRTADFFQDAAAAEPPVSTGLLDLNRYVDP